MKVNKLFLLAMGLVAVGCSDNQLEEPTLVPDAQGEAVEVVINATIAPESRATSDLKDLSETITVVSTKFDAGDEIGVYLNWATNDGAYGFTHENVKFTAQGLNADESAMVFKPMEQTMLLAAGNYAYAYYPYAATGTDFEGTTRSANLGGWDGYHYFKIADEQVQDNVVADAKAENNAGLFFDGFSKYVYLISKEKTMSKEGNTVSANLEFRHAFSYATLLINNTYGEDYTFEKAEAVFYDKAGNEIPVVGDFGVKLDDAAEGAPVVALTSGTTGTMVTLVPAEAQAEGGADEAVVTSKDLKLVAGETTKLVATVAPYENAEGLGGAKFVIYTKEGYVFEIVKDFSKLAAPLKLEQSKNVRFSAALEPATMSTVVTSSEIAEAMLRENKETIELDLAADIELKIENGKDDFWGYGDTTKEIKINGNGHKVTFVLTSSVHNDVTPSWPNLHLTIENASIYASSNVMTADWRSHFVAFCVNVALKNVDVYAGLAMRVNADLNDVRFHGVDFDAENVEAGNYALWLTPIKFSKYHEGTIEVTMDNCSFDCTKGGDRAIKIDGGNHHDEFYNAFDARPIDLTIKNTTFKTAKKAAVVVNTLSGANITFGEGVDISGVAADKVNHVWIDTRILGTGNDSYSTSKTDYFEYGKCVQVNGGNWMFEQTNGMWSVNADGTAKAANGAGTRHAILYGLEDIQLVYKSGSGANTRVHNLQNTLAASPAQNIRIWAAEDDQNDYTVQAVGTNLADRNVTLENVKLESPQGGKSGLVAESLVCKNVEVAYGSGLELNTAYASFDNCVFTLTESGAYVNTNAAEEVSFNKCVFNTQGSAILVKNPENAAKVSVTNSFFNAAQQYLPVVGETAITGMKAAAIEIDNATADGEAGLAHVVKTEGNSLSTMGNFSGEWRIRNYVEVDGGVTVNDVAYEGLYLVGKLIYQPTGSDEWHVAQ